MHLCEIGAPIRPILNLIDPIHYAARSISTIAILTFAFAFVIRHLMTLIASLSRCPPKPGNTKAPEAVMISKEAAAL